MQITNPFKHVVSVLGQETKGVDALQYSPRPEAHDTLQESVLLLRVIG